MSEHGATLTCEDFPALEHQVEARCEPRAVIAAPLAALVLEGGRLTLVLGDGGEEAQREAVALMRAAELGVDAGRERA